MFKCNNIYSVWDKKLIYPSTNYRRDAIDTEYKAGRDKERSARVYSFEEITTKLLTLLGVKNMYPGVLEADDVISWLSDEISTEKVIVSVDQDMLQLIDRNTYVYSPIKDIIIDKTSFQDHVGVKIEQFIRYKSLMGDKSDNLPGIDRCGTKTAIKLVNECRDDDMLVEKLGKDALKPYFRNLELIDLKKGLEYHPDDEDLYVDQYNKLRNHQPDMESFRKMAESMNMNKISTDFATWSSVFAGEELVKTLEDIVNSLGLSK